MERAGAYLGERLGEIFEWSEQDREIAAFSLTLILSSAFFLALLAALSLTFSVFAQALTMALSAGALRTFAGGAHLSTGWRCGVVSAGSAVLVALGAKAAGPFATLFLTGPLLALPAALGLAVAFVMARTAPVDVPEKPITSDSQRRRLRLISILLPFVWGGTSIAYLAHGSQSDNPGFYAGIWLASAAGLLWETFSTVPSGTRFVHWLDQRIERISHHKRQFN